MQTVDFAVIGAGIVGAATARALLLARPGASVLVLDKEAEAARHQTGHNSGVIHSGIYYAPGSLKATLCREGAAMTKEYAAEKGLPFAVPGKLIVATDAREHSLMKDLAARSVDNGLETSILDGAQLRELEPQVSGVAAIHVPATGIIDYGAVTRALLDDVRREGEVRLGEAVLDLREFGSGVEIRTTSGQWRAQRLVACAGLQSDRIARLAGLNPEVRIVPFRGEYFEVPRERTGLVQRLIYPVPDPDLPFLGVHLSPTIDGRLTVGPNAVLGLAREGYRKGSVDLGDVREMAAFAGLWRLARHHVRVGAGELWRSASRRAYLQAARKYCPQLRLSDLVPREAGIRAQAVRRDGTLVHDFQIEQTDRMVHVLNAPSPAATAAMPIGRLIAERVLSA